MAETAFWFWLTCIFYLLVVVSISVIYVESDSLLLEILQERFRKSIYSIENSIYNFAKAYLI